MPRSLVGLAPDITGAFSLVFLHYVQHFNIILAPLFIVFLCHSFVRKIQPLLLGSVPWMNFTPLFTKPLDYLLRTGTAFRDRLSQWKQGKILPAAWWIALLDTQCLKWFLSLQPTSVPIMFSGFTFPAHPVLFDFSLIFETLGVARSISKLYKQISLLYTYSDSLNSSCKQKSFFPKIETINFFPRSGEVWSIVWARGQHKC